jgi:hypothetical protein
MISDSLRVKFPCALMTKQSHSPNSKIPVSLSGELLFAVCLNISVIFVIFVNVLVYLYVDPIIPDQNLAYRIPLRAPIDCKKVRNDERKHVYIHCQVTIGNKDMYVFIQPALCNNNSFLFIFYFFM